MSKHGLEGFLLFGDLCYSSQFAVYMHQKGSAGYFFHFLVIVGIKGEKRTLSRLAHDKTWFGRRFCCLVVYATLHNLPCICILMAPAGTFFTFLLVAENKGEKRSLAHKTCFGNFGMRFCCLVIYANLI